MIAWNKRLSLSLRAEEGTYHIMMNQNGSEKEVVKKRKTLKEQIENEEIRKVFRTQAAYRQNISGMILKTSKETGISTPVPHKETREKQRRGKM